uniref:Uncharacterized protein n=1 Tax=Pleurostomum flabellatum TaxID=405751 RepID=A0A7T0M4S8_9EUKA|nr:hypothetical protein J6731_mgp41 [Pleurostomum flabellatum]QPL15619.1 hypothetical protein [Pleurostomum flabellatum]
MFQLKYQGQGKFFVSLVAILLTVQFTVFFHSESLILAYSFLFLVTYLLCDTFLEKLFFNANEEELDFSEKENWIFLLKIFLRFKNWCRFYYRFCIKNLFLFYEFVKHFKTRFVFWLKKFYKLSLRRLYTSQKAKLLGRFVSLLKMRNSIQYKNNPFFFFSIK